jgi:hypothetical protein
MSGQANGDAWLAQLRELARELELAIQAIAANEVQGLEDSIARQRQLCRSMSEVAASHSAAAPLDAVLARHLLRAADDLRRRNACYASLLRHSGRNLRMFAALGRQTGHYPAMLPTGISTPTPQRPSWSCEG